MPRCSCGELTKEEILSTLSNIALDPSARGAFSAAFRRLSAPRAAGHRERWADVPLTKAWSSLVLKSWTLLLLTAFAMTGSACVASREVVRHAHAGTVVDSTSGAPIADAAIVVESWSVRIPSGGRSKRRDVFRTTTDVAGRFYVSDMKELFLSLRFRQEVCK